MCARSGAPTMLATDRCWECCLLCYAMLLADVLHGGCSIQTPLGVCISALVGVAMVPVLCADACSLSLAHTRRHVLCCHDRPRLM